MLRCLAALALLGWTAAGCGSSTEAPPHAALDAQAEVDTAKPPVDQAAAEDSAEIAADAAGLDEVADAVPDAPVAEIVDAANDEVAGEADQADEIDTAEGPETALDSQDDVGAADTSLVDTAEVVEASDCAAAGGPTYGLASPVELVEESHFVGAWPMLAVDTADGLHAVWYDGLSKSWDYARTTAGQWEKTTLESTGDVGRYAALAIGPGNHVHAVAYSATDQDLHYATNASGSWLVENVTSDSANDCGQWAQIAVTADGTAHVVYLDASAGVVRYRKRSQGTWSAAVALTAAGQWDSLVLRADTAGALHAAWHNLTGHSLEYGKAAAGGTFGPATTVDATGNSGVAATLDFDATGAPQLVYLDGAAHDLRRAWQEDGLWKSGFVKSNNGAQTPDALRVGAVFDGQGALHACVSGGEPYVMSSRMFSIDQGGLPFGAENSYGSTDYYMAWTPGWCSVVRRSDGTLVRASTQYDEYGNINGFFLEMRDKVPGYRSLDYLYNNNYMLVPIAAAGASDGTVYATWYDPLAATVRYSWRAPGGLWQPKLALDNGEALAGPPALAVAPNGQVTVAYYDSVAGNLKVVQGSKSTMNAPVVVDGTNPAVDVGGIPSVAVNAGGTVAVSYYDKTNSDLRLAIQTSAGWVTQTIAGNAPAADIGQSSAVAFDGAGQLHVAARNATTQSLVYSAGPVSTAGKWTGGPWQTLDAEGTMAAPTRIAVSGSNVLVGHCNTLNYGLHVVTSAAGGAPGSWTTSLSASSSFNQFGLTIDSKGIQHVAFANGLDLLHASRPPGGAWGVAKLAMPGTPGHVALAMGGPQDDWHILYRTVTNPDLIEASNTWASWSPGVNALVGHHAFGASPTVAVDSKGVALVAYYGGFPNGVRFARYKEGRWFAWGTSCSAGGGTGARMFMAFDANDVAHLAFTSTLGEVSYGRLTPAGDWQCEVIGSINLNPPTPALAVASDGTVHIAYREWADGALHHAVGGLGAWKNETVVDAAGDPATSLALALDNQGQPHIAYQTMATKTLRYTAKVAGAWQPNQLVESGDSVGEFPTMALDAAGKAHVAHRDVSTGQLHYASNATGSWTTAALSPAASQASFPSLLVTQAGAVHVAYVGTANHDLWLVSKNAGGWAAPTPIAGGPQVNGWLALRQGPGQQLALVFSSGPGPVEGAIHMARLLPKIGGCD